MRPRPSFACRSRYAFAPNTFLLDCFRLVFDAVGELLFSEVKFRFKSWLWGVTEVRNALVDLMPSLVPILVLIEREDGSLSRPPL